MTNRDKTGLAILIGLFAALALALFLTMDRPSSSTGSFENNVLIDQRVRNLNKTP
tara:strand:+ start:63 stop:227 length:165 start_codon:yes stop_codon:yes gene_type:complete